MTQHAGRRLVSDLSVRLAACLAVVACAVVACSSAPPHPVVTAAATTSLPGRDCAKPYLRWRNGPVRAAVVTLTAAMSSVQTAVRAGDATALRAAMRPLTRTAVTLASYPMPRCADSGGLYAVIPTTVYLAGQQARSARDLTGLRVAAATLSRVTTDERRLSAEIVAAVGGTTCRAGSAGGQRHPPWPC